MQETDTQKMPATHQPTKAEMERPIKIEAALDRLAEAVVRGGAPHREHRAKEGP